jgi:8-oxo-dGTP diphosphatase
MDMKQKRMGIGFGVLLCREGKMILGKRHVDPEKASSLLGGAGSWTFPGGKVDFGESLECAVAREVLEETGLEVDTKILNLISVSNDVVPTAHFITLGFKIELDHGDPRVCEPDEITVWGWFPIAEPPAPLYDPTQRILENLKNQVIYSAH